MKFELIKQGEDSSISIGDILTRILTYYMSKECLHTQFFESNKCNFFILTINHSTISDGIKNKFISTINNELNSSIA